MDSVQDRVKLIIFSVSILMIGMGFGRFLYTALFPLMLAEHHFDFSQLSYIASSNYIGYLVGALLFSLGYWHQPQRVTRNLFLCLGATSLLLFLMAFKFDYSWVILIRFLAGVSSAGIIIFGSMLIFSLTTNKMIIGSLFSGVGAGILIGNELILLGRSLNITQQYLWLIVAIFSGVLIIILLFCDPKSNDLTVAERAGAKPLPKKNLIPWIPLVIIYGLAGFGYIITATYLPVIAQKLENPFISNHLWSLLGLGAILSCFLWLYIETKVGILISLIANLLSQSLSVFISYYSHIEILLIISAFGVGLTFMGTTILVMTLAKQTNSPKWLNLLGVVTLSYSIGQIVGPILTNIIQKRAGSIEIALLLAGIALLVAAFIVSFYYFKRKSPFLLQGMGVISVNKTMIRV